MNPGLLLRMFHVERKIMSGYHHCYGSVCGKGKFQMVVENYTHYLVVGAIVSENKLG